MTPTRKELLELIEELASQLLWRRYKLKPSGIEIADGKFSEDTYGDPRFNDLAKRVNAALANPPIIEEKIMYVSIDPSQGKIDMEIDEDWLLHLADRGYSQIDSEHEGSLTAQEDEQNLNREIQ